MEDPPTDRPAMTASSADEAAEEGAALAASANQMVAVGHGAQLLPTVLSDVPVAILLVDLDRAEVTFANPAAMAMAGDTALPCPVGAWSAGAGLVDADGEPLGSGDVSLLGIARGSGLAGQTVRVHVARHGEQRMLWATGFPLQELGTERALVILFEVTAEAAMRPTLQERAIVATNIAFTITDPLQDDNPLVWVNPAFTAITGYAYEDAVGHNCRFLQGPASDPDTVALLRDSLARGEGSTVVLLNYRRDGTAFWNQLTISPVFDGAGELVSFVGVQTDVTERIRADIERDRAYAAELQARERLSLLAEATGALMSTLDVGDALRRLAEMVVPALADWVVFATADDDGDLADVVTFHRDGHETLLASNANRWGDGLGRRSFLRAVIDGSRPLLIRRMDPARVGEVLDDDELVELVGVLGMTSAIFVPLLSRHNRILGALAFISGPSGRIWSDNDLEVAADLGRRAGLAVDNARLYQLEHRAAETLQRSLLPEVPPVDGLTLAARYLPANSAVDVGGDFYEIIELPDGTYALAVGDVVGHDLTAAAAMGQLRVLLRSVAWDRSTPGSPADPAQVLDHVDELVQALAITPLATVLFGRLDKPAAPGGAWTLSYCNAGHPPALLRRADGRVEALGEDADVLLGAAPGPERRTVRLELEPGSLLLAYTDGLIETPGGDISDSLAALSAHVQGLVPGATPEGVVESLTATMGHTLRDDIALLAIAVD